MTEPNPALPPTAAVPSTPNSHPSGPAPTTHPSLPSSTLPPPSRPTQSTTQPPAHATTVDPAVHATLLKDYARLKRRVESLEEENDRLRTSLWEVSWRWGKQKGKEKKKGIQDEPDKQEHPAQAAPEPVDPAHDVSSPPTPRPQQHSSMGAASATSEVPDLTPRPTQQAVPTAASAAPGSGPSRAASATHQAPSSAASNGSNTPIQSAPPPPITSAPQVPTPSSLAASLFPSVPAPTVPPPSSAKSYDRSTSLHRTALPSSLRRGADDRDRDERETQRWKWGRAYELKAHRGAVYCLKFAADEGERGILLGSGGFDGVKIWKAKTEGEETEGEKWDEGDVEEVSRARCCWAVERLLRLAARSGLHTNCADALARSRCRSCTLPLTLPQCQTSRSRLRRRTSSLAGSTRQSRCRRCRPFETKRSRSRPLESRQSRARCLTLRPLQCGHTRRMAWCSLSAGSILARVWAARVATSSPGARAARSSVSATCARRTSWASGSQSLEG